MTPTASKERRKGVYKHVPEEEQRKIIDLFDRPEAERYTYKEIEAETGWSRAVISRVIHDAGLAPGRRGGKRKGRSYKSQPTQAGQTDVSTSDEPGRPEGSFQEGAVYRPYRPKLATKDGESVGKQRPDRPKVHSHLETALQQELNEVQAVSEMFDIVERIASEARDGSQRVRELTDQYFNEVQKLNSELEALQDRLETVSSIEKSLQEAIDTIGSLGRSKQALEQKVQEFESRNRQRAMAVHSTSSRYS